MQKATVPNRWFAGWRSANRVPQDDPADLGTAFGLDLSMEPYPLIGTGAPPVRTPRQGWVQRLGGRKPAV